MPDRASIGLDNPAFNGRVRHNGSMPTFMPALHKQSVAKSQIENDLTQQQTLISGMLTQPLFKPKSEEKLTPPDRSRYKQQVVEQAEPRPVRQPGPAPIVEFRSQWDEPVENGPVFSIPAARRSYDYSLGLSVKQSQELPEAEPETVATEPEPVLQKQAKATKTHTAKTNKINVNLSFSLPRPKLPKLDPAEMINTLRGYSKLQLSLLGMALVMFIVGITVSAMTLHTNKQAAADVSALSKKSADQPASGSTSPPSTVKPSSSAINNYTVGPNMPRYLNIPKLGVQHARVLSLGILNNGALATPNNVFDVGWYNESSLPGQPGAMLIDGHVSSWTSHGVFYGIKNLSAGDMVQVVRGDGTVFNYQVVKTQVFDHDNVDMQSAVTPVDPGKPGLNLITCTGDVIKGTNEFNERVVVYTKQV